VVDGVADNVEGPWAPDNYIPDKDHVYMRVLFPLQVSWVGQSPAELRPNKSVIRNSGSGSKRGMSCDWCRYRPDPTRTREPNTEKHSVEEYGVVRFDVGVIRGFAVDQPQLKQDVKHDPDFRGPGHPLNNRAHSLATGPKGSQDQIADFDQTEIRHLYAISAHWVIEPDRRWWPENPDGF
jgi:hypothetical protein